jgi:hypothetical protein
MNWERRIVGNKPNLNLKNLYFVQVKVEDFRYKDHSWFNFLALQNEDCIFVKRRWLIMEAIRHRYCYERLDVFKKRINERRQS